MPKACCHYRQAPTQQHANGCLLAGCVGGQPAQVLGVRLVMQQSLEQQRQVTADFRTCALIVCGAQAAQAGERRQSTGVPRSLGSAVGGPTAKPALTRRGDCLQRAAHPEQPRQHDFWLSGGPSESCCPARLPCIAHHECQDLRHRCHLGAAQLHLDAAGTGAGRSWPPPGRQGLKQRGARPERKAARAAELQCQPCRYLRQAQGQQLQPQQGSAARRCLQHPHSGGWLAGCRC